MIAQEFEGHEGHNVAKVEHKSRPNDWYWVCHDCKKTIGRACEVYSRVVGYLRPTSQWNKGKQQEFKERKTYRIKELE